MLLCSSPCLLSLLGPQNLLLQPSQAPTTTRKKIPPRLVAQAAPHPIYLHCYLRLPWFPRCALPHWQRATAAPNFLLMSVPAYTPRRLLTLAMVPAYTPRQLLALAMGGSGSRDDGGVLRRRLQCRGAIQSHTRQRCRNFMRRERFEFLVMAGTHVWWKPAAALYRSYFRVYHSPHGMQRNGVAGSLRRVVRSSSVFLCISSKLETHHPPTYLHYATRECGFPHTKIVA
jgi:hypothetical protein